MVKTNLKCAVIMDPLHTVNVKKDSTYAMLREAHKKNWDIYIIMTDKLFFKNNNYLAFAHKFNYEVHDRNANNPNWFHIEQEKEIDLTKFDIILFRKDPPVDIEYL